MIYKLTFWWSNAVVLREILTQAFGSSCESSYKSKGSSTSATPWKGNSGINKPDFMEFIDDWEETRSFTSGLEQVESWIFSRIVESIWWQTLTPNMQSLAPDTNRNKYNGNLSNQQEWLLHKPFQANLLPVHKDLLVIFRMMTTLK